MRPLVIRILIVLGAVLAALGLIAGHVNRELLDGPTFASHVDEIRRDDDVAAALGTAISDPLILANPDLVAIRPLVESVATQVAGGDLLSGPTRPPSSARTARSPRATPTRRAAHRRRRRRRHRRARRRRPRRAPVAAERVGDAGVDR